jgi:hypothetical protein
MRYFLCTLNCFSTALCLGIPEDSVAAITIHSEEVTETIKREEGGNVFFSLPHFFNLGERTVRHGIVLKPFTDQPALRDGDSSEEEEGPRNVLLVSAVEREADIAPEEIFPLPEILAAPGRIPFFTGVWFANSAMIAFIDPASLIARILKDTEGGPAA